MDTVLIVLGVLGFGAIIISAYVFTVAARNYVDDDDEQRKRTRAESRPHPGTPWITRSNTDRRSGLPVQFPLFLHGTMIKEDRRHLPDRRLKAA